MPGLRSTYSIDSDAIKVLESYGMKIIVGAMMAVANADRNEHDQLVVPMDGGRYDHSVYNEKYSYVSGGVAYQEIYNSDAKDEENNGIVAKLLPRDPQKPEYIYQFAFTTTYGEGLQTAENFTKGLIYRGFFIVTDTDGTQGIYYANMEAETFDTNGASISIYELSDHINKK